MFWSRETERKTRTRNLDLWRYLLYMRTSGFQSLCGGIRMSSMPPYSDLFHRMFTSFQSWSYEAKEGVSNHVCERGEEWEASLFLLRVRLHRPSGLRRLSLKSEAPGRKFSRCKRSLKRQLWLQCKRSRMKSMQEVDKTMDTHMTSSNVNALVHAYVCIRHVKISDKPCSLWW